MNEFDTRAPKEYLPYLGIRYQIGYYQCNLNCPYCIAYRMRGRHSFDLDIFRQAIDKIKHLPYRVCLRIGIDGEVFTSPEILRVIKDICNMDNSIFGVSFSTNLHAGWETVIKPFIASINTARLGMGCTLHDTVIKDVDRFFDKAARLKAAGVLLYIGYVALPGRMDKIRTYRQRCLKLGIPFILNTLVGAPSGLEGVDPYRKYPRDYTAEERRALKPLWDTPHSYKMLVEACKPRGMACSAGKQYVHIDKSGNVHPCRGMEHIFMGNILRDDIRLLTEDTVCPADKCWCGNENQALRIVDKYYQRTRTLRLIRPQEGIPQEVLYQGYNPSIYAHVNGRESAYDSNAFLVPNPEVAIQKWTKQGDAVLINRVTTEKIKLNGIGPQVWNLCDGAHTRQDILRTLESYYEDIEKQILGRDLDEFIDILVVRYFLRLLPKTVNS